MTVRWALSLPMWTFLVVLMLAARLSAQGMAPPGAVTGQMYSPEQPGFAGPYAGGGGGPGGPGMMAGPAMGMGGPGMGGPGMDMGGGGMGGPGYGDPAMYGGDPSAMYGDAGAGYGPGGYEDCGPYRGLLGDFLGLVGPYADGGCCAPRFFDISVEAMFMQRDDAGRNVDIGSAGIAGPIVLSTDDFRFDERPSFRLSAWLQFRSMGNIEFNYYGLFHHSDVVQVDDPANNLFSALSQFGTVPFGGFVEDGNAAYQRIGFSSSFDNFEFNYRRHWQGPDCRFQGSYLFGMRYFKLEEDFQFASVSTFNQGSLLYDVNTDNSLTGGQLGGDLWVCIIPGLRVGTEAKVGVYGNHSSQGTSINANSLLIPYTESVTGNDVAFVGDASIFLTYRLTQQFNLKFGYNFLFAEGVSLATENFNPVPPNVFVNGAGRTADLNDNGNIFYNGASLGVEYNW